MFIHADKESVADSIAFKFKTLGCSVTTKCYSISTLAESNLSEEATYNAIFAIGCTHSETLDIVKVSYVPVINVISSKHNPIHVLADIFPIYEKRDFKFKDVNFCWHGNSDNSAHSWLEAARVFGFNLTLVPASTMYPDPKIFASCKQGSRGRITLCKAFSDAKDSDVVINDTLPHDSNRCSMSRKIGGRNSKGRYSSDDISDFWDNELCILMAVMIWIQE